MVDGAAALAACDLVDSSKQASDSVARVLASKNLPVQSLPIQR
jgi:hypothetical protein